MSRHSDLGQHGIVTLHATPHQLRADPAPFMRKAANAYRAGKARPRLNIFTLPRRSVTANRGRLCTVGGCA